MAFDFIKTSLASRAEQGLLRKRSIVQSERDGIVEIDGRHYLNFASNDYLGMRQHPDVLQSFAEGLAKYGSGSGASPLVTGYSDAHDALEQFIAKTLGYSRVLLFSSGFAANQGVCQALFSASGTIVSDKLMHASFIDGALSSNAQLSRFRHNDMSHCEALLAKAEGDVLLATEGVFSMDGDTGRIGELGELASAHGAWLMVDDAHGFMTSETIHPSTSADIYMATFGKAVGTAGAFVAGSDDLIDYLMNFSRHYIYSTAMPAAQACATLASIKLIMSEKPYQRLAENIAYFRHGAVQRALPITKSESAIQPVIIGCPKRTVDISERLRGLGIWCGAMRTPTVPKGSDRLRITLSALHSQQDIDALLDALALVIEPVRQDEACQS
ncbi:aminotransferase class I/II-fold pyridoxal phosphate-dependent enzyme [Aestuariibacter salexigens]|uniref:aminotransferase class I/II-fold pyridoxal phosphate-dependent enzyme n=1 Tax=Aestuariibacter salexigens TaxID=226010 RepID=UPI00042614CD|nr:8-amino-7-oxononanoate synthase [Aestuariibacter salexigens]